MKILITGGAGFIGTNLIPKLIDLGHEICVIDNLSHGTYVPKIHNYVTFVNLDCVEHIKSLNTCVEIFKPDITYMFHGLVSIYDCHRDPQFAIKNNLIGSANVFDALIKNNCPRVVFAETSAVYEQCPLPENGYTEDMSDPTTMYAVTKAALLLMAKSYARTRGLKFTALRYFNVAGAMQDYRRTVPPLFAGFALRMIGGNNPIIFGDGNRRRDFIHVDDINEFHIKCTTDDRTINEVFNLGLSKSYSLFDIGEIVHGALRDTKYITPSVVKYDFMPEINGVAFDIVSNTDKAKALGWYPQKTIDDAVKDTITYLITEVDAGHIDPNTFMTNLNFKDVKIG